jgi:SET domain-containing protein
MIQHRFLVRRSSIQGLGLFAASPLPGRRKIGELSGEIRALPGARNRQKKNPQIYLVELDEKRALDCSKGNFFKYLNHACRPNCYLRVCTDRVEIYTRGVIASGTELTVDYRETPHTGGMRCGCGQTGCRGLL